MRKLGLTIIFISSFVVIVFNVRAYEVNNNAIFEYHGGGSVVVPDLNGYGGKFDVMYIPGNSNKDGMVSFQWRSEGGNYPYFTIVTESARTFSVQMKNWSSGAVRTDLSTIDGIVTFKSNCANCWYIFECIFPKSETGGSGFFVGAGAGKDSSTALKNAWTSINGE